MSVKHQHQINKFFPNRPIMYQPGLAIALKSIPAAIMLGQLLYWHTAGSRKDCFVYKTMEDMYSETGLTRSMQLSAIDRLLDLGIIDYKVAGVPAKRCFLVKFIELQKMLPSLKESCNLKYMNPPMLMNDNMQTLTKNTQETTAQNTHPAPALSAGNHVRVKISGNGPASIATIIEPKKKQLMDDIPDFNDFDDGIPF
jgi:hypothetical protein